MYTATCGELPHIMHIISEHSGLVQMDVISSVIVSYLVCYCELQKYKRVDTTVNSDAIVLRSFNLATLW